MTDIFAHRAGRRHISQGEYAIDGGETATITTLLGSCVAACIWDPGRQIGGMNHVLFVDQTRNASEAFGFGVNSMELLLNGLYRLGARRGQLKAKVFGGSHLLRKPSDAGQRNAAFVTDFLRDEGIDIAAKDTGGTQARRVEFWPGTGRARVKLVTDTELPEDGKIARVGPSDPILF
ncbi:chemotaxis protein CheD [Maritimibacter sp. DP1N21-5]|uniref:chemotaxis protein CheD n=1 Tax=Maritimibacter sp. DP1N21-5 TaxID=2836867 RepID=UPI001C45226D|nr:chemotaxis protein CheD [Maritimibacter sp. DP1N21-5]MBV7409870.1 chemotaxis protein CheD [Maritimibacter sp. DP1N21-5]